MAKQTSIVFPYRQPPAGGQPKLPGCRAWRIIPIPAAEVAATQAITAAVPVLVPTAPTGCFDGVLPVWVKTTFPSTGQDLPGIRFVNHDGWNIDAQGSNWRIEYVNGGSASTDQFAYAVETTDDLNDAGQVNSPIIIPGRMVQTEYALLTASSTAIAAALGRKSVEVYNAGPNSILVGPASANVKRVIAAGSAWALDYTGVLYGKANTANQVAGAATVVTEIG